MTIENMKITYKNIEELIPYARNSRTHSDEQVAQIAASIKEFGWTNPVLVDGENGIIAGHGRVLGARKLGIKEIPTIELSHLTNAQRRAYVIADNKLALNAGWDMSALSLELQDLDTGELDLSLLGFSEKELEDILTWAPDSEKSTDNEKNITDESRNLLMIECVTESELEKLYNEIKERGFKCKILN